MVGGSYHAPDIDFMPTPLLLPPPLLVGGPSSLIVIAPTLLIDYLDLY